MNNSDKTDRIITWVEKSIEFEDFNRYEITVIGKPEKGEGFLGDIIFANVRGQTRNNTEKSLDLVIKHGKDNDYLRKVSAMKTAFRREIFLYDKVFPAFRDFQVRKNILHPIDITPKCYKSLQLDNLEILVLENLKQSGYELHDSRKPLNVSHLKTILIEYGRFHALSFALRDQNQEEFHSLLDENDFFKEHFSNNVNKTMTISSTEEAIAILEERHDLDLVDKLKKTVEKGIHTVFYELVADEEPQSVISHGDNWNNNFLFKYEDNDKTAPSHVKILDWQLSALRSPVFDLSYLLYANGSKQELDKSEELLETYYRSFANYLRELGSDPEKLFTYEDLKRHWKKYSLFGALFMPTLLKFALCKKDEAPALEDYKEGQELGTFMSPKVADSDAYYERMRAVFTHYFENA